MIETIKRHTISFLMTFVSAFFATVAPFLMTVTEINVGLIQSVVISGVYAGVRAIFKIVNDIFKK